MTENLCLHRLTNPWNVTSPQADDFLQYKAGAWTNRSLAQAASDLGVDEHFNVRTFGATGDGSTDDTLAIQAAIDACPDGGVVYIPGGNYIITSLSIDKPLTLRGDGITWRGTGTFGHSSWSEQTRGDGSILYSSATSGVALNYAPSPAGQLDIEALGVVGPGSGTSTGLGMPVGTARNNLRNVMVANFSIGINIECLQNQFICLSTRGCSTGVSIGNGANTNTFIGIDVVSCVIGIKNVSSTGNVFNGGAIQGCSDTGIQHLGTGSAANIYSGVYLENSTATYAIDLQGGDYNRFDSLHATGGTVRVNTSQNWITGPQSIPALTLSGSRNFVMGHISNGVTDNGANNVIIDTSSGGATKISLAPGVSIRAGANSPEGAVAASPGSLYLRNNGSNDTTLYIKATGTTTTGWRAVTTAAP